MVTAAASFLARGDLDRLFAALAADGRRVVGPTVVDGAVVYDELSGPDELPTGRTVETSPGTYRLSADRSPRAFDYGIPLTAWKRYTHPAIIPLTRSRRDGDVTSFEPIAEPPPRLAFLGVRACELAALRIQERVMRAGPAGDADHVARREASLVIAVECAMAAGTCFCTSMGTGPEIPDRSGVDLVLSELDEGFVGPCRLAGGRGIVEYAGARCRDRRTR